MLRICANCAVEGRGEAAVLGEKEPLTDRSVTHSICAEHWVSTMAAAVREGSAAAKERYITWPALYEEHGGGG